MFRQQTSAPCFSSLSPNLYLVVVLYFIVLLKSLRAEEAHVNLEFSVRARFQRIFDDILLLLLLFVVVVVVGGGGGGGGGSGLDQVVYPVPEWSIIVVTSHTCYCI